MAAQLAGFRAPLCTQWEAGRSVRGQTPLLLVGPTRHGFRKGHHNAALFAGKVARFAFFLPRGGLQYGGRQQSILCQLASSGSSNSSSEPPSLHAATPSNGATAASISTAGSSGAAGSSLGRSPPVEGPGSGYSVASFSTVKLADTGAERGRDTSAAASTNNGGVSATPAIQLSKDEEKDLFREGAGGLGIATEGIPGLPADDPAEEYKMLAAVDMGTNSFHMVVVRADSHGRFQIVDVEKEDVRLGANSMNFSVIHPDAEERALSAIQRLQKIAAVRGAQLRVVATSAVREARNKRAFVRRIKDVAGVDVEILSGREEACLIYLGILQALPIYDKTVLTVDIGGGSTEFVLGREGKPLFATSLKLGHIRLTERCLGGGKGPIQKQQIEDLRRHIQIMLADSGVNQLVQEQSFDIAIGSSGTIETIEQMISAQKALEPVDEAGGPSKQRHLKEPEFTLEELQAVVKRICKAKTSDQRSKLVGLPEKRADVIVGGSILLEEIFLAMGIEKMKVSPYALREGVIVDTLAKSCLNYQPAPDIRRASVLNLASRFNTDCRMDSALHSAELALQILSGLQTCKTNGQECVSEMVLSLDEQEAFLMEAATILHYVGMFISHTGYHKHSYYLIKNNEHLLGFSPMEIEVIALLAKYHRKKVPSSKDEEFAKLPTDVQQRLRTTCAIMRVAVALDRCDTKHVARVSVLQDMESCVLAITPAVDEATGKAKDVSLEIWAARNELEFFNKTFKKNATIVVADVGDVDTLDADRSESLSS